MLSCLVATAGWAMHEGFVPALTGSVCTLIGYDPIPSYQVLTNDYNESPYCARRVRGETWF